MKTFILLSTLTPQGLANLQVTPERLLEVNREVEALGGRVLRQWAVLGPYDFLTIIEAPDELTVAKLAGEMNSRGSSYFETLPAISVDELDEMGAPDPG
ncbi:MAG: GYD domain-containing protein [Thermoleophilia bacterium]|nr:GYD domain-containing protein [Thermoleophilia bacterium]